MRFFARHQDGPINRPIYIIALLLNGWFHCPTTKQFASWNWYTLDLVYSVKYTQYISILLVVENYVVFMVDRLTRQIGKIRIFNEQLFSISFLLYV